MTEPTLLAFDTATETLAVALCIAGRVQARQERGGALASLRLLPLAKELLDEAGLGLQRLDAVAFGRGPGAFTGLRTACAAAQGLALGLGIPVLALDSLLIVAEDAAAAPPWGWAPGAPLWVAMDARMDEVYAGCWLRAGGLWQCQVAPALYGVPALAAHWQRDPPEAVAGTALAAFGDRLGLVDAAGLVAERDRAGALGRLALAAWHGGQDRLDAAQALPLYLRDKVALTTAERAALAAGR
ncbi:MAG: tRNA (adenosine(37)-N6)-threonylcarbamoyltransferase complex dimerization subunit type 1 TsaB [Aquabacterium sp.]